MDTPALEEEKPLEEQTARPNYPSLRKETPPPSILNNRFVQIFIAIFLGFLLFLGFLFLTKAHKKTSVEKNTPTTTTNSTQNQETKSQRLVWVNSPDGLNLRSDASVVSSILETLPDGTELSVISEDTDWYFVDATTRGYVSKKFVTLTKPTNAKKIYNAADFNFKFIYPENYKIQLSKGDPNTFAFSFNDSTGGFNLVKAGSGIPLTGFIGQNYQGATVKACDITIGNAKECKMLTADNQTFYLVNTGSIIYRIDVLTNYGNFPADLTGIIFPSFYFEG